MKDVPDVRSPQCPQSPSSASPAPHGRSRVGRRTAAFLAAVVTTAGLGALPLVSSANAAPNPAHQALPAKDGSATPAASTTRTVAPAVSTTRTVAADGSAQYRTVQAAVNASAAGDTVSVAKGTYREIVNVPVSKKGLTIAGTTGNAEDVVITYDNAAGDEEARRNHLRHRGQRHRHLLRQRPHRHRCDHPEHLAQGRPPRHPGRGRQRAGRPSDLPQRPVHRPPGHGPQLGTVSDRPVPPVLPQLLHQR